MPQKYLSHGLYRRKVIKEICKLIVSAVFVATFLKVNAFQRNANAVLIFIHALGQKNNIFLTFILTTKLGLKPISYIHPL